MKIKSSDILFRAAEYMANKQAIAGMCEAASKAAHDTADEQDLDFREGPVRNALTRIQVMLDDSEAESKEFTKGYPYDNWLYWGCRLLSKGPAQGSDARRARSLHLLFLSHLARDAGD